MLGAAVGGSRPNHFCTAAHPQVLPGVTLAADSALLTVPPQRTAASTRLGLGLELTVTYNFCMLRVSKKNDLLHEKQMQIEKSRALSKTEPRQFNRLFIKHVQSVNNVSGQEQGIGLSLPDHTSISRRNKLF